MYLTHHLIGHLPFLAAVARFQSFTQAGESLHLSQAAVSYQIRQLEQKLGLLLVVRHSGSKVHLTAAGQILVDEYRECEKRLQLTLENLGSAQPKGTLKMAVPVDFGSIIVPAMLAEMAQVAPQLTIELHVSDEVTDLVSQQYDLAIRSLPRNPGLRQRLLAVSLKQLVASREYVERFGRPASIAALAQHRLLMRSSQVTPSWEQLLGQEEVELASLPQRMSLGNTFAMAEGVRQGLGIAILPKFTLIQELETGSVVPLLEQYSQALVTRFYLVHLPAPQMERFAELVNGVLQKIIRRPPFEHCFQWSMEE